jgi:hypothetical protein
MLKKILFLPCLCLLSLGSLAKADTIGPNCGAGSCLGSTYTLTYNTTANPNVFDIFLTVDATGFTNSNTDTLKAVALSLTPGSASYTAILLANPSTFGTTLPGGVSGGPGATCDGTGNFFCSPSTTNGVQVGHSGDVYNFEWQLTFTSGGLLTGADAAAIKALYVDTSGNSDGLTSAPISDTVGVGVTSAPLPEPSSLFLLGTGVIGIAALLRRRFSA